jgi:hypothetical protein
LEEVRKSAELGFVEANALFKLPSCEVCVPWEDDAGQVNNLVGGTLLVRLYFRIQGTAELAVPVFVRIRSVEDAESGMSIV